MSGRLLEEIWQNCPKDRRLLGLDIGKKTIGLALSDENHVIATPLRTIERKKFVRDMEEIGKIVRDYEIGGFVLGYPVNMDGTHGPACDMVRSFADEMKNYPQQLGMDAGMDLWIALWDERLSTASVEAFVDEYVNIKKSKAKARGIIDKLAAHVILQGALDFMGSLR